VQPMTLMTIGLYNEPAGGISPIDTVLAIGEIRRRTADTIHGSKTRIRPVLQQTALERVRAFKRSVQAFRISHRSFA
jgi:hypothetical protein